jgi:hypothetical protein
VEPRRKARVHEACGSPDVHQERERPFAADADVGDDRSPDDPYRHNRHRTGLRRTRLLEHGQLYACGHGRRHMRRRLAAATPGEEGGDGGDNERVPSPLSSTHYVWSLLPLHCAILASLAGAACSQGGLLRNLRIRAALYRLRQPDTSRREVLAGRVGCLVLRRVGIEAGPADPEADPVGGLQLRVWEVGHTVRPHTLRELQGLSEPLLSLRGRGLPSVGQQVQACLIG